MNFLDMILIILLACAVVGGVIFFRWAKDEGGEPIILAAVVVLTISLCIGLLVPFTVIDKGAGSTIGEITSVDKNFFGTTAVYIKTSEISQEKYCIEDNDIALKASDLIGKKVKVYYNERVGLFSTGKCSQAPIIKIKEVGNEKDNDKSANEG